MFVKHWSVYGIARAAAVGTPGQEQLYSLSCWGSWQQG